MLKSVLGYVVTLLSGVEDIGVLWRSIFVLNSRLMFSEFNVIGGNYKSKTNCGTFDFSTPFIGTFFCGIISATRWSILIM
jgi:hypothetical protein